VAEAGLLGREAETIALGVLGRRRVIRGEREAAKDTLGEALRRALGFKAAVGVRWYLELIADLATDEGEDALAARLSSAAETVFDLSEAPESPFLGDRANGVVVLRERLGDEAFRRESGAGRLLGMDEAGSAALAWAEGSGVPGGVRQRPR
jgi:hypothetical protein